MRTDPFSIIPSPLGLDNYHKETAGVFQPTVSVGGQDARLVGEGQPIRLRVASNVDVTYDGEVERRRMFAGAAVTTGQGIWAVEGQVYYQANGTFYRKAPGGPISLISGLARAATVIPMFQGIFVSDGVLHRQIVGDTVYVWGQSAPSLSLGVGAGTLAAGTYLVQATFVDMQGNEGPASAVVSATVTVNTGITVNTTIPSGSTAVNIYVSGVNQKYTNFLISRTQAQLPYTIASTTSTQVSATVTTAQMSGPIAGLVGGTSFRSYTLLWKNNAIFRSDAWAPHLFYPKTNIMQFPSTVRAVFGAEDGIWVGTETGLWWVTGEDPRSFVPFKKADVEVLAGSISLPSDDLPVAELTGKVGVFATRDGLVALGSTGQLRWLTKTRYTFSGTSASFAFAQKGDLRQLFVVT